MLRICFEIVMSGFNGDDKKGRIAGFFQLQLYDCELDIGHEVFNCQVKLRKSGMPSYVESEADHCSHPMLTSQTNNVIKCNFMRRFG